MIFFNSKKLITSLIEDINNSKVSIDIELYIWDPDEIGKLFEDSLASAVQRGVKVRVIVDRIGSLSWISDRKDAVVEKGIDVRVYRPILSFKTLCNSFPDSLYFLFNSFNRRNHRKTFIIDKNIGYVGSFNIMKPALEWKEITVKESDAETIGLLTDVFNTTWNWLQDEKLFDRNQFRSLISKLKNSDRVTTTQTSKLRKSYKLDFLKKIDSCQKRLWFITPYFNPPGFLLKALIAAAQRGVDVRIMVPMQTDPAWFKYLTRLYYSHLIKNNIKIFEYESGILHAKTALFDDGALVGSGNLNFRSFYLDLELNLVVVDPKDLTDLRNDFIKDMANSREIKLPGEVKMWERVFGSFLTLFKTSF